MTRVGTGQVRFGDETVRPRQLQQSDQFPAQYRNHRAGILHVGGCPPFFVGAADMDPELKQELHDIRTVMAANHAEVMQRFHGEHGTNGIYGRVQSLEDWRTGVQRHVKAIWSLLLASMSGFATWMMGGK